MTPHPPLSTAYRAGLTRQVEPDHHCPSCGRKLPTLTVRGDVFRVAKRTHIPQRNVWISDDEVLYIQPIPMIVVEKGK